MDGPVAWRTITFIAKAVPGSETTNDLGLSSMSRAAPTAMRTSTTSASVYRTCRPSLVTAVERWWTMEREAIEREEITVWEPLGRAGREVIQSGLDRCEKQKMRMLRMLLLRLPDRVRRRDDIQFQDFPALPRVGVKLDLRYLTMATLVKAHPRMA